MNKIASILTADIKSIAIAGHMNPDGDCVGSCLGLYLYLSKYFKHIQTDLYLEQIRDEFSFLEDLDKVKFECDKEKVYDLIITCDASSLDRIGVIGEIYNKGKDTLCIDHHISNTGFANHNHIVSQGSSSCEVLYELLDEDEITKSMAEALYMGLVHDTGIFQYPATTSRTMEIAGRLMDLGIDYTKIIDQTYLQKTFPQNKVLGKVLLDSFLLIEEKVIAGYILQKDMLQLGVTKKDLDGIVSQLRITKGIEVAIFLYEISEGEFKISLRSNGLVNVSDICTTYGGGGHIMAAGCTIKGTVGEIVGMLEEKIRQQLEKK